MLAMERPQPPPTQYYLVCEALLLIQGRIAVWFCTHTFVALKLLKKLDSCEMLLTVELQTP